MSEDYTGKRLGNVKNDDLDREQFRGATEAFEGHGHLYNIPLETSMEPEIRTRIREF